MSTEKISRGQGEKQKTISDDRLDLITQSFPLLFILAVGTIIRLNYLFQPMKYDEAYSFLRWASQSFSFITSNYTTPNNHVFHTILMRFAYLFLGHEPWQLRLPAFIAGILMIPATYFLFKLLYNEKTALLASGLVATSSMLIEFSTNARGYTLIGLLFLIVFSLAYLLIKEDKVKPGGWLFLAFFSTLGFYTVPVFLYPFGVVFLWSFLTIIFEKKGKERQIKLVYLFLYAILTVILTSLLYLPVILSQGVEVLITNKYVLPLPFNEFIVQFQQSLIPNLELLHRDIPSFPGYLLLAGFLLSLVFHKKVASHKIPIVLAFLGFMTPALFIQRVVLYNRLWLFAFPLYYGTVSAGLNFAFEKVISVIKSKTFKALIFSAFLITFTFLLGLRVILNNTIYYSNHTGSFREAEKVTLFLRNYLKPEKRILAFAPFNFPLKYYFAYHKLPLSYFAHFSNLGKLLERGEKIILIVEKNRPLLASFDNKMRKKGLNPKKYEKKYQFKLIKSFEEVNLFLLEPKRPANNNSAGNL